MKKNNKINILRLFVFVALLPIFVLFITYYRVYEVNADPPNQPPGLEIAKGILDKHTPELMSKAEVTGTALGLDDNGEPVIKVFVLNKQFRGIPQSLDGFPVEVEVTGMFVARSDPTAWFPRPTPIGVSTGHPDITAGTIGCRVTDGFDVFALSNNHVYANSNDANNNDNVLQPGPYDGGVDSADAMGTLYDFEPIKFDGSNNTIDAAIAITSTALLSNSTPYDDGYGIPSSSSATAFINQGVKKYGRTTGLTYGTVYAINATTNVCYECAGPFCMNCKKLAKYVDQIIITPGNFSAGGDSGSVIVTNDNNNDPVGLLFAGSSSYTIANEIDNVFDHFGVNCDDTEAAAAALCNNDADCDDGNLCNGNETCDTVNGCQPGTPVNCDDSNACTMDSCDPVDGSCINDVINCNDNNECTDDSCDINTGCVFIDNGSCVCSFVGENCTDDSDCCSNKCRGKPGAKTCK